MGFLIVGSNTFGCAKVASEEMRMCLSDVVKFRVLHDETIMRLIRN